MTEVKAEVPMSEVLTYAPDLRAVTGGQGELTLEFLRYEDPARLARRSPTRRRKRLKRSRDEFACEEGEDALLASPSSMARNRDIRTNQLDVACDICGRTLLRGEHPEHYLAGGERRTVCDLCITRASTRAGFASRAPTTSSCAIRAARAAA